MSAKRDSKMGARLSLFVRSASRETGKPLSDLADYMGCSKQLLNYKLNSGTWYPDDIVRVAEFFAKRPSGIFRALNQ